MEFFKKNWIALLSSLLAITILFLFLFNVRGGLAPSHKSEIQSREISGRIVIDSPEVYTRERLVNDRFYEDAWLRERLQKVNELEIGIQGLVRSQLHQSANLKMNLGVGPSGPKSDGQGDSKSNINAQESGNIEEIPPQDLFRDLFKQLLDIRSAIRSEIIENQLDDRHDIASNTLYNFKFDSTVITPGNDTSAWACVQISISKAEDEVYVDALPDLYNDWIDYIRGLLRREYIRRVNTITKRFLCEPPDVQELENFLEFLRFDFSNKLGTIDQNESDQIIQKTKKLVDSYLVTLNQRDKKTREILDCEFQIAHAAATIIHKKQIDYDANLKNIINYLIAKWVVFDLVLEPNLDRMLDVAVSDVGNGNYRIDTATRVVSKDVGLGILDAFEEINVKTEFVNVGFEEFCQRLSRPDQTVFTYSVNPKQSIERISDVVAQEVANLIDLKMGISDDRATAALGTDVKRSMNALTHAIRRKPIIVGYADRMRSKEDNVNKAVFGWLIGPRFQSDHTYRHVPVQNALSALVSLPASWPSVKIKVDTTWLRQDNSEDKYQSYEYHIRLPGDFEKLTDSIRERGINTRFGTGPEIDEHNLDEITLRIGEEASILIPGRNLWRSTVVTVGAQSSHMITVLPNMEGIIAHFKKIKSPSGKNLKGDETPVIVRVWTSEGVTRLTKPAMIISTNTDGNI